ARIFEKATRAQNAAKDHDHNNEGLSLEELKQIGASTGIDADYIVQAIAELNEEARGLSVQKHMGVPYALSRSVKLPDTFSEKDWERLVVDLRRTFKKRGTIKQDGSFREWSHGFTHAYVEPAENGYELRIEVKNGNTKGLLYSGILYVILAILMFIALGSSADPGIMVASILSGILAAGGIGSFVYPMIFGSGWAKKKEEQIEGLCERAKQKVVSRKDVEVPGTPLNTQDGKFLTLEDEKDLNQELEQFAMKKRTR
ncbi:MAG: hypothetical protein KTR29_01930, partial [Rhodothermaceae bacterium]|nr:hypothetical protein [Rhodothermaceae bacterium]